MIAHGKETVPDFIGVPRRMSDQVGQKVRVHHAFVSSEGGILLKLHGNKFAEPMEEFLIKVMKSMLGFQHHNMSDFYSLNFYNVNEHCLFDEFVIMIVSMTAAAYFFIQILFPYVSDSFRTDITGRALFVEENIIWHDSGGHCQILVLQVDHIDGIAEQVRGGIHQILKTVPGKQGIDQDVHTGSDLLDLGQTFQNKVQQLTL